MTNRSRGVAAYETGTKAGRATSIVRWSKIVPQLGTAAKECDIQALFEGRATSDWQIAGKPDWLPLQRVMTGELTSRQRTFRPEGRDGYGFRPDILWYPEAGGEVIILELKCAAKYEPMALAEVAHHAFWLREHSDFSSASGVRAAMVTQYNAFLRASMAYLADNGFIGNLHLLEFDLVHPDGATVIWFDEPVGQWRKSAPPPCGAPRGNWISWYRMTSAPTWIAVQHLPGSESGHRPAFWKGLPYSVVSRLAGGGWLGWANERDRPKGEFFITRDG